MEKKEVGKMINGKQYVTKSCEIPGGSVEMTIFNFPHYFFPTINNIIINTSGTIGTNPKIYSELKTSLDLEQAKKLYSTLAEMIEIWETTIN